MKTHTDPRNAPQSTDPEQAPSPQFIWLHPHIGCRKPVFEDCASLGLCVNRASLLAELRNQGMGRLALVPIKACAQTCIDLPSHLSQRLEELTVPWSTLWPQWVSRNCVSTAHTLECGAQARMRKRSCLHPVCLNTGFTTSVLRDEPLGSGMCECAQGSTEPYLEEMKYSLGPAMF